MNIKWVHLTVLGLVIGNCLVIAATNDLSLALQKGLFEEEANHNLSAAIQAYQSVVSQLDEARKLAATAVFRLGECYRKQGKTNEAMAQYERVVRDFSDESTLATLSRQSLADLGSAPVSTAAPSDLTGANAPTSAEAEEVKRIQAMIKESPDLINAEVGGVTPLHKAAEQGELIVAQFLLANGANVEARNARNEKWTPLHYAANRGHKAMAELLLSKGASVQTKDSNGNTPLHLAALMGFRSLVEVLLAHGADVNAKKGSAGETPLHMAITRGFRAVAELLLASHAGVNAVESGGNTPLHNAARNGDRALTELLLANKAEVNAANKAGQTPLHLAANGGHTDVLETLLAQKADVNAKDENGVAPLVSAILANQLAAAKLLVAHKAELNFACNPMMNSTRQNGIYPVHVAMSAGSDELLELLLANGADPNVKSGDNADTPLHWAARNGRKDQVEMLLKHKADPNLKNAQQDTPLLLAIKSAKSKAIVELLLDHKADPNEKDQYGAAPLHRAVEHGQKEIAEALLAHKAEVNVRDGSANTPLYWAVSHASREMVELLLANGADANARNNEGKTPLMIVEPANVSSPGTARGTVFPYPGAFPPPAPVSAIPTRTLRVPGSAPEPRNSPGELAELLREHGATENLPDFSSIRIMRKGSLPPTVVFKADTNSLNRFSLLEVIANYYYNSATHVGFSPVPRSFSERLAASERPDEIATRARGPGSLPFPDFSRLKIHRPNRVKPVGQKETEITVNLLSATNGLDCAKDVQVEFGDIVEIPESEHTLAEQVGAVTEAQSLDLRKCLKRPVTLEVKGQRTEVWLSGFDDQTYLSRALKTSQVQSVLRSSSDLSRIRIRRTDPGQKKPKETAPDPLPFWNNKEPISNDLWLRAGDVIEVPDKP